MLTQVADDVFVHVSQFCQSNAVVIQSDSDVLLIDAGVLDEELACLARDIRGLGGLVVAGFSTCN